MMPTKTTLLLLAVLVLAVGCSREPVHLKLVAKKYGYEPSVLHGKKGQPNVLELSTMDVHPGFAIKDLGIDQEIPKGQSVTVSFTPRKTGEFRIACTVVCGPMHDDMAGTLVVE